ncbi:MAG: dienelactone hydrolase family protein, partial [Deltaproteobacteria bacterium]|nr:dienelactone hydrolase family protein [Deltaproteobacteria bacterium]
MSDVSTSTVEFASDQFTIRAFLAKPAATGKFPAVVVIQEWWGLNDHIRD